MLKTDGYPILDSGPKDADWRLVLSHGAGAPMDSPFMTRIAELLADRAIGVRRFEFPYMAQRRETGRKKPPDRPAVLEAAWRSAVADTHTAFAGARIAIGGKSMGGRFASMLAADDTMNTSMDALITLGYPFHPPGKPDRLRTEHLPHIACPVLMVQGTRDPFGKQDEVEHYSLPPASRLCWIPDGDHDLKPRKASGLTHEEALTQAADAISDFLSSIA